MKAIAENPIRIRVAVPEDASSVTDLLVKNGFGEDPNRQTTYETLFESERLNDSTGIPRSIVAYAGEEMVGFINIFSAEEVGEAVDVEVGAMVTSPEHRSMRLLLGLIDGLNSQEDEARSYNYIASAKVNTLYRGLQKPEVQRWALRRGYKVYFGSEPVGTKGEETVPVVLSRARR